MSTNLYCRSLSDRLPFSSTRYFLGNDDVEYSWKELKGIGCVVSVRVSSKLRVNIDKGWSTAHHARDEVGGRSSQLRGTPRRHVHRPKELVPGSAAHDTQLRHDRLDLHHHIFRLALNGALHRAPLASDVKRVLDFGTGTVRAAGGSMQQRTPSETLGDPSCSDESCNAPRRVLGPSLGPAMIVWTRSSRFTP